MLHRDKQLWEDAVHAHIPVSDPSEFTWPANIDGEAELRAARLARESHKPRSALTNFSAWLLTKVLLVEPESYVQQQAATRLAEQQASALAESILQHQLHTTTELDLAGNDGTRFHIRRLPTEVEGFKPVYDMFVCLEDEQQSLPISFEAPSRAQEHYQQISDALQTVAASHQRNQLFA